MENRKIIEKNCEEIRNRSEETIIIEDDDEISPKIHNRPTQETDNNVDLDGSVITDGGSKVDVNLTEQTIVAHCSRTRKMNKPTTTRPMGHVGKVDATLKEQIIEKPTAVLGDNARADVNFKEQTIIVHCSRNFDKTTPIVRVCGVTKTDINLKEPTIVAHCSRNADKATAIVMDDIPKTDVNSKEQIDEAESSSDSDDVIIIEDKNVDQVKSTNTQFDPRPYKCDLCDKSYTLLRSLNIHKKNHKKEKPFQCNYCEQQFSTIGLLHKHIVIHSADKPYKCGICNKAFAELSNLGSHFRVHRVGRPLYSL